VKIVRRGVGGACRSVVLLAFAVLPAAAQELRFDGAVEQGGLVIGHAAPGAVVRVGGRRVQVTPGGDFLVGFGRDAGSETVVRVVHADGRRETRTLTVRQRQYPEQHIDGLPAAEVTPGPAELARIRADAARIRAVRARPGSAEPHFLDGFAWPVRGRISGVFGSRRILNGAPRRPHYGLDIAAAAGTPIGAAAGGVVALVAGDMFYTGKTLIIDHGHGLASVYAHMSEIGVAEGEVVARGQAIGRIGASGRATGPHLHWGISLFRTHLDPALVVPAPAAPE
jgi:murein DD-endopeptidase MepM/ murein hydrolase activator NlpD